jgi:hypothetical protein
MGHRSFTARLIKLEHAQPALPVVCVWLEDADEDVEAACAAARRDRGLSPWAPVRFVFVGWVEADGRTEQSAS